MTRHPASVFTARFQDCEFVYHVLAQVVTMLHLTHGSPLQFNNDIVVFIKQVELQILYRYLRADDIRPYEIVQKEKTAQFLYCLSWSG